MKSASDRQGSSGFVFFCCRSMGKAIDGCPDANLFAAKVTIAQAVLLQHRAHGAVDDENALTG